MLLPFAENTWEQGGGGGKRRHGTRLARKAEIACTLCSGKYCQYLKAIGVECLGEATEDNPCLEAPLRIKGFPSWVVLRHKELGPRKHETLGPWELPTLP